MSTHDPVVAASERWSVRAEFRTWTVTTSPEGTWRVFRPARTTTPDTGWKIHISASRSSAPAVLERTLPLLAAEEVAFKHAASLTELSLMAGGRYGWTQVGKFVTVYPHDAVHAQRIARRIHDLTLDLQGPRIMHERPLEPGSLVHLRYGAISERWLQLPTGQIVPGRQEASGVVPDNRLAVAPTEPGSMPGSTENEIVAPQRLVGGRYARVQCLHVSLKGSTWLGFDTTGVGDLLVVKEAYAHVMESADGVDARRRLRHEGDVLRQLARTGHTPRFVTFWEEAECAFLVYEHVEGVSLEQLIANVAATESRIPEPLLREWVLALCAAVAGVHDRGLVVGDLKPGNIILTHQGFVLVDLELAGPPTDEAQPGIGSTGYMSPQQGDPAQGRAFTDDIYALGATILATSLLVDASRLPDPLRVAQYELQADPGNPILEAVTRCLDPDPARRPGTVDEFRRQGTRTSRSTHVSRLPTPSVDECFSLATDIGERILLASVRDDVGTYWRSPHPIVAGVPSRDLYAGTAGTAAYLCQLFAATRDPRYLEHARTSAEWLWRHGPAYSRQVPMPGLYFGESGPGFLYLLLHAVTGEEVWRSRALAVGAGAARAPSHSPDLLTGDAGLALFLAGLWHSTGVVDVRDALLRVAARLTGTEFEHPLAWPIPPGHDDLSGNVYVGLSHGGAGVAYVLSEVATVTGCQRTQEYAVRIAEHVSELARACSHDPLGLVWPVNESAGSPCPTLWCHGSPGIRRMLTTLERAHPSAARREIIRRAAHGVAVSSAWCGSVQCHGLAGNAEALLDAWQSTGDRRWHDEAMRLAGQLLAYFNGAYWRTEVRDVFVPDFLVGEAGIGSALLRLADPDSPHLISVHALSHLGAGNDRRQQQTAGEGSGSRYAQLGGTTPR